MASILDNLLNSASAQLKAKAVHTVRDITSDAADKLVKGLKNAAENTKKELKFDSLPKNLDELKAWKHFDMSSPYCVAAMTLAALTRYKDSKEDCLEMIDFLNGPSDVNESAKQFLNDRFMDDKWYVPISYFKGTSPDNNYKASVPYEVTIMKTPHSDDAGENYLTLYVASSGADSPRPVTLRYKPSTKEWFLWSYEQLLADIRLPKEADPWA